MEAKSVSLEKQNKEIRPLGRLVSIKHNDLDAASSSRSINCWSLKPEREDQGKGHPKLPASSLPR